MTQWPQLQADGMLEQRLIELVRTSAELMPAPAWDVTNQAHVHRRS